MSDRPVIRNASEDDLPALQALSRAAYLPYVAELGHEPAPMAEDFTTPLADRVLHVIDVDGEVAGYVILRPRNDHALLENLAVSPDHQGKRLGSRLMDFAEAEARRQGFGRIDLYTHVKMARNVAIYRERGYRIVEEPDKAHLQRVYLSKTL